MKRKNKKTKEEENQENQELKQQFEIKLKLDIAD